MIRRFKSMLPVFAAAVICGCNNSPPVSEFVSESAFRNVTQTAFSPAPQVLGWPGMALFDYDNDGDIDIFVTNVAGAPNMFYVNDGDGNFTFLGNQAGLALTDQGGVSCGVGDFDNDGWLDLIIARQSPFFGTQAPSAQLLYMKNMGPDSDGAVRFEDMSEQTGLDAITHGTSIGVGDIDNDGLLDLYVGRYDLQDLSFQFVSYLPDTPNVLLRNTGVSDGVPVFEDITESAGVAGTRVAGLAPDSADMMNRVPTWAVYLSDVNQDGFQDIFSLQEIPGGVDLFINNGDLTFTLAHEDLLNKHGGWMGATGADYDRDGDVDYFLANIGADAKGPGVENHIADAYALENGTPYHRLLRNDGNGDITDVISQTSVTPGVLPPTNILSGTGMAAYEFAFGCAWFDQDLDGWQDIYWIGDIVLSGLIRSGELRRDFHGVGRFLRSMGEDGFSDQTVAMGLLNSADDAPLDYGYNFSGRALAAIDLNGDGFPDICRTNAFFEPRPEDGFHCLMNPAAGDGHWITIRLEGTQSNRFGIGARVEATAGGVTQVGEVVTTTSAFTAVHPQVHLGLGDEAQVETLTVHWPSGAITTLNDVAADAVVTVQEQ